MSKQTEALKLALEALGQIDEAIPFPVAKLAQKAIREALAEQPAQQEPEHEFKNFHRALCERFGYTHDERDWKRDQVSLIEWIAKQAQPNQEPAAKKKQEPTIDLGKYAGTYGGYIKEQK